MNAANLSLAEGLVSSSYIRLGANSLQQRYNAVKALLSQRKIPRHGWDDATIEMLLQDLAFMDTNNFRDSVGMGEREGRCASALVARRHWHFTHGIGRSGNLTDEQPKAAGSTLAARLTSALVKDALRLAGMQDVGAVTVLPVATGMALTLTLMALKPRRPTSARWVLWPRIDQQTCLKAVQAAGLDLLVLPNVMEGDELRTDMDELEREISNRGADNILCVLSTTSCFATRAADRVEAISKVCQQKGVGHIINNAYGVQSAVLCRMITRAWRRGRVDAVVQSTDKNFMVPVGGSVVAAGIRSVWLVSAVNHLYPGRASFSPVLDVLITLLSLGASGWERLLAEREALFPYLQTKLSHAASLIGERLLHTPHNPISLAITLDSQDQVPSPELQGELLLHESRDAALSNKHDSSEHGPPVTPSEKLAGHFPGNSLDHYKSIAFESDGMQDVVLPSTQSSDICLLGSMLFTRCVSGCRVIYRGAVKTIGSTTLVGWGASDDSYPHAYLTAAAALGGSKEEVDEFVDRLIKSVNDYKKMRGRKMQVK